MKLYPQSALYQGIVSHHRYEPKPHHFQYRVGYFFLKLSEIPTLFNKPLLFSYNTWGFLSFQRRHYYGDKKKSLSEEIKNLIRIQEDKIFEGEIFLLTNVSYLGFCFNPVSFYYCYNNDGVLSYIISEITNTPWNERHPKVFSVNENNEFNFKKDFHVSPFFPMEMNYRWKFSEPAELIKVHMQNFSLSQHDEQNLQPQFQVFLRLQKKELSSKNIFFHFLTYPLLTITTVWAIYWQAALLYFIKKAPFYSHPKYYQEKK